MINWWKKSSDFEIQRRDMVESQIKRRGVKNKIVLEAMLKVERHLFMPSRLASCAYNDEPQSIGEMQTISQPYIVALMTEALFPEPTDRVLEIGTGSAYQTAVLAEIVSHVYSIEIIPELHKRAKNLLEKLEYTNVTLIQGNGYLGLSEEAPFDKIIVTAAPPDLPRNLTDQLKIGGKLVIPVGINLQILQTITKNEKGIHKENITPVRFVPMTGREECPE
jgi:protein-L-isoaspartate(D-aspartate) O-methyltransferase